VVREKVEKASSMYLVLYAGIPNHSFFSRWWAKGKTCLTGFHGPCQATTAATRVLAGKSRLAIAGIYPPGMFREQGIASGPPCDLIISLNIWKVMNIS